MWLFPRAVKSCGHRAGSKAVLPHRKAREITPQHHQTSKELLGLQMGVSPVHTPLPAACQPGLATPPDTLHLGDVQIQTLKHCFFLGFFFHFLREGKASPPSKQRAPEDMGSCGMEIKIFLLASSLTHHVLRSVSSWPEVFSANAEVTGTQLWGSPGVPCSGGTAVLPPMGGSSRQICPQSPRLFPAAGLRGFCNTCGLDLAWDISGKVVSEFLSRKLSQSMLESLPEERQNAQAECHLGMAAGFFLYLEGK